jgi:hypothetical protein
MFHRNPCSLLFRPARSMSGRSPARSRLRIGMAQGQLLNTGAGFFIAKDWSLPLFKLLTARQLCAWALSAGKRWK